MKEHKLLGTWVDEMGKYGINIGKRGETLQYMISSINQKASPSKVGIYAAEARLNLAEIVIIPSLLYNAEGYPQYEEAVIKKLESIQLSILVGILGLPKSTPYCALLMEVGWWTMRARLAYKKLMLYHNIVRSDEKRVVKKIVKVQEDEKRETTWYSSIVREMKKYSITLEAKDTLKSTWKKEVKARITEREEGEIREKCMNSSKARIVKDDEYKKKDYLLGKVSLKEARNILHTRMNMNRIPGNYKGRSEGTCPLCTKAKGTTEHYFQCDKVRTLKEVCGR